MALAAISLPVVPGSLISAPALRVVHLLLAPLTSAYFAETLTRRRARTDGLQKFPANAT